MNTDVRSGLAVLCLAAIMGLARLGTLSSDDADGDIGRAAGGGALIFAAIGLVLVMKGVLSERGD